LFDFFKVSWKLVLGFALIPTTDSLSYPPATLESVKFLGIINISFPSFVAAIVTDSLKTSLSAAVLRTAYSLGYVTPSSLTSAV
jgi:hypothetical protein